MTRTLNILDNPVIGVFATCTEELAIVPTGTKEKTIKSIEDSLQVQVISTLISGSTVVGSLVSGNSHGLLIPRYGNEDDLKDTDVAVSTVPSNLTAIGNTVLANDSAALVHPNFSDKSIEVISETLGVNAERGTIAGIKAVGMAGVANNNGILVHPNTTPSEMSQLEELFDLPIDVGTVNYGSQMVGSGVIANTSGYLAGYETTGYELGRIEDVLGFI
jgi:translation initiation factor 6